MYSTRRSLIVLGCTALACLGPGAHRSEAQQPQQGPISIESFYPAQLDSGGTTVLHVAVPGRDNKIQSVEVSPPAGVTVASFNLARNSQAGQTWWDLSFTVARDAAPGNRSIVIVSSAGRSLPMTVRIPDHVPAISDLKVLSAPPNGTTVDFQFAATDRSGDLGNAPYVWFSLGCGGDPEVGVVRGKMTNGVVRVSVPRTPAARASAANPRCGVDVRTSDSNGIESNTLTTALDAK